MVSTIEMPTTISFSLRKGKICWLILADVNYLLALRALGGSSWLMLISDLYAIDDIYESNYRDYLSLLDIISRDWIILDY